MAEAGVVLRARSGFSTVAADEGGLVECQLRGRMKRTRQTSDLAVIGDRVRFTRVGDGTGVIEEIEPRHSRFSRRQPGPRGSWREDVMIANLDLVAVVFSCDRPPPNPRLIDRFLVVAEHNEVEALVVANKVDLVGEAAAVETFGAYERIGYPVAYVSARTGAGIEDLHAWLRGRLSVVTGPSGVGKSTLLNAIRPGLRLATADVSEALRKGVHTTTLAELHPLGSDAGDGFVADTPGIRELGLWEIPGEVLAWCFVDFRPYLGGCAFNDCSHTHEPRCAIRTAVDDGRISPQRHDSYCRILTSGLAAD